MRETPADYVSPFPDPTPPPGACPEPPALLVHARAQWDDSLRKYVEAFQDQRARTQSGQVMAQSNRGLHRVPPGWPWPPAWYGDPTARAVAALWRVLDAADLRALGYCLECGSGCVYVQAGRCVYTTCGHFRVQGQKGSVIRYSQEAAGAITPERRAALLALIGRHPDGAPTADGVHPGPRYPHPSTLPTEPPAHV